MGWHLPRFSHHLENEKSKLFLQIQGCSPINTMSRDKRVRGTLSREYLAAQGYIHSQLSLMFPRILPSRSAFGTGKSSQKSISSFGQFPMEASSLEKILKKEVLQDPFDALFVSPIKILWMTFSLAIHFQNSDGIYL